MPDIRTQLKLVKRRVEEAETPPRPRFDFGAWLDRALMETAVHIPVFVAIGISCYGWEQYGWFAAGLIPLTVSLSWLLSRTYAKLIRAHRGDVGLFLAVLGGLAFATEAYGVHLGLERFNHYNAANGLQTFDDSILVLVSIMLGLMNLFSRWGYITGDEYAVQVGRPESRWFWHRRRARFAETIARNHEAPRLKDLSDDDAVACFKRNGGWPLGYKPTAHALARVAG